VADYNIANVVLNQMRDESHQASKEWFPETADDLNHHALALCGEVGEVANIVKKAQRGSIELDEAHAHLADELADVFIYLLNCCAITGLDLAEAYRQKQTFNEKRFNNE